jgi:dihydroorotate dehydrogenase electron transfer subunit
LRNARTTDAVLEERTRVSPTSFLLELSVGEEFPRAQPGNFVSVATAPELTLPRPFAVAGTPAHGRIEILVESRGRGTGFLAEVPPHSRIAVIGPLGNAFTKPPAGTRAVLVAGGIGVAGLRLLARELADSGSQPAPLALVGAASAELLLDGCLQPPEESRRTDGGGQLEVRVATDDGSLGHRGVVTDLLARALDELSEPVRVYCCGPPAMIRATTGLALEREVPCEALLEEIMACGVGACRGCVVETKSGYRCVCTDGPIFDASEILFREHASV